MQMPEEAAADAPATRFRRDEDFIDDFQMAVASRDVKDALQFYIGGILDGERDAISMSRFCGFEMDELYRLDKKR